MFTVKVSSELNGDEVKGPFGSHEEAEQESERLKASGGYSKNEIVEDAPEPLALKPAPRPAPSIEPEDRTPPPVAIDDKPHSRRIKF